MEKEEKLVQCFIAYFSLMIEKNDAVLGSQISSVFLAVSNPDISIHTYIQRFFQYGSSQPSVYVLALIYIDRICKKIPTLSITSLTVHMQLFKKKLRQKSQSINYIHVIKNNCYHKTILNYIKVVKTSIIYI